MKRLGLALLVCTAVGAAAALAGEVKIQVAVALDADTPPAESFAADAPQLMAFFLSTGSAKGEKVRGVWIAEDVGDAAPANTKIDEATVTCDAADCSGAFTLSKPAKGWPEGDYRVEIYWDGKLAKSAKFTVGDEEEEDEEEEEE